MVRIIELEHRFLLVAAVERGPFHAGGVDNDEPFGSDRFRPNDFIRRCTDKQGTGRDKHQTGGEPSHPPFEESDAVGH